jgi:hypothetical protein
MAHAGVPTSEKSLDVKIQNKNHADCFFDLVPKEFEPTGMTVNAAFYMQVLTCLQNRIMRVQPAIATNWKLHHDNMPCHGEVVVWQLLAKFR